MADDLKVLEEKIRAELERAGVVLPEGVSFDQFMVDLWEALPASEKEKGELGVRAERARSNFTVRGFKDFYWCIWRRECAPYADKWIKSFMGQKWPILECFRGSTKSTTLTITFSAFVLGHHPYTSELIVQANDTAANRSTASIANIVKAFSGWKACFPNVVPDEQRGWGANGYFIQDMDVVKEDGYDAWVEKTMRDHIKDPSFVGAGITSADIVGMHPRWLFFDDIHDRNNSTYPKDRENIIQTVRENVVPVITKPGADKPFFGVACTFWDKADAYHVLLATGLFEHIKTPIFYYEATWMEVSSEPFVPDADFNGKPVKLTWPDGYSIESVMLYYTSNDLATFKREYLCDENSDLDRAYKYQAYRSEEVDPTWVYIAGVDPVGVLNQGEGISHFAMLEGCLTPYNSVVVTGGVLEKCGSLQGEEYVVQSQSDHPNFLRAVVEGNGIGAIFSGNLTRHPGLVVQTVKVSEIGQGSKLQRQYKFLEPLARIGALRVSDASTPILNAVRDYFERFPNFSPSDPLADIGDALVLLAYGFPSIWTAVVTSVPGRSVIVKPASRNIPNLGTYHYLNTGR